MKIGTISGKVTYLRKAPCLAGEQFFLVDTRTEQLVAADLVGAMVGDRVLLVPRLVERGAVTAAEDGLGAGMAIGSHSRVRPSLRQRGSASCEPRWYRVNFCRP